MSEWSPVTSMWKLHMSFSPGSTAVPPLVSSSDNSYAWELSISFFYFTSNRNSLSNLSTFLAITDVESKHRTFTFLIFILHYSLVVYGGRQTFG